MILILEKKGFSNNDLINFRVGLFVGDIGSVDVTQ